VTEHIDTDFKSSIASLSKTTGFEPNHSVLEIHGRCSDLQYRRASQLKGSKNGTNHESASNCINRAFSGQEKQHFLIGFSPNATEKNMP
jgi:hypothetical protein